MKKWVLEDVHKHEENIDLEQTRVEFSKLDDLLLDAMKKRSSSLYDQKKKDEFRVMISKALKDSHFSRETIDSATNF